MDRQSHKYKDTSNFYRDRDARVGQTNPSILFFCVFLISLFHIFKLSFGCIYCIFHHFLQYSFGHKYILFTYSTRISSCVSYFLIHLHVCHFHWPCIILFHYSLGHTRYNSIDQYPHLFNLLAILYILFHKFKDFMFRLGIIKFCHLFDSTSLHFLGQIHVSHILLYFLFHLFS